MNLREWRLKHEMSQGDCATALGLEGGARSFQRLETGENKADADMVERIVAFTNCAITAADMHDIRLAWLKDNRPEKFAAPMPAPQTGVAA